MKIAALQMTSGSMISANLQQAEKLIAQACADGANLVLLPENFAFFAKQDSEYLEQAEQLDDGEIQRFLQQQAIKHQCYIVAGVVVKGEQTKKST